MIQTTEYLIILKFILTSNNNYYEKLHDTTNLESK